MIKVFVDGTLKPGAVTYRVCDRWLIELYRAIALGIVYPLPVGYPAMVTQVSLPESLYQRLAISGFNHPSHNTRQLTNVIIGILWEWRNRFAIRLVSNRGFRDGD